MFARRIVMNSLKMRFRRISSSSSSSLTSWFKSPSWRRMGIPIGTALLLGTTLATTSAAETKRSENISMSSSPGNDSYLGETLSVVLIGADENVAMEKTYPALYSLFKRGLLPKDTKIYCLASSSSVSSQKLKDFIRASLVLQNLSQGSSMDSSDVEEFLAMCIHHKGDYSSAKSMADLGARITRDESKIDSTANRVFYLAVPENSVLNVSRVLKNANSLYNGNDDGWTRLVLEKSSARDTETIASRADELANLFGEKRLYRIDHYLGMEMVQNMLVMRFANSCFEPIWNRNHVAAVYFTFKETELKGAKEDEDIIRDVIQNHLLQVLSLVAMEAPSDICKAESVTSEKVKLLDSIRVVRPEHVVLGQCGDENEKTPTFATVVLYVDNPRWSGVPFIIKAGRGMDQRKIDVRLQLKDAPGAGHMFGKKECPRNELVIRLTPNESIFIRANVKAPGLSMAPVQSELDLTYRDRYGDSFKNQPSAYARMLLNVLRGDQSTFVRRDELQRTWDIFDPVLKKVDNGEIDVKAYDLGSRGPSASDELAVSVGYDASTIKRRLAAGPRDDRPFGGGLTARELKVYIEAPVQDERFDFGGDHMPDCFT